MLTTLNTFCMVLGYITLFYLICCAVIYWLIHEQYIQKKLKKLNSDKVPLSDLMELFFTTPAYFVVEIFLIIKEKRNERNNDK